MRNGKNLQKIIIVVGPTASGKSDLAVKLAKKLNGEIVSADSRQVYKGMDVGTGKVPNENSKLKTQNSKLKRKTQNFYYYRGVQHHLLNVASPKRTFTVARYVKLAERAITDIRQRGKLPIVCGGTGFYIQALVDGIAIPQVPPNIKLRQELEKKPLTELARLLRQKDPARASVIDLKNKRRIIRALEIIAVLGKVPKINQKSKIKNQKFCPLFIGIQLPPAKLRAQIKKRLLARLKQAAPQKRGEPRRQSGRGMAEEVRNLHDKTGLSWKKLESFGLEYRYVAQYRQNTISYKEMARQLELAIWHYAKRQMTWFKKDKRILWVESDREALRAAKKFLKG